MKSNKPKLDISTEQTIYNGLSEPRFDGMFYNNSTAAAVINQDTTFDKVNEAFCKAVGYTREELMSMKWTQLVTEDIRESLLEKNEKRVEDPKSFTDDYEITFYNKKGEKQYAQMAVSFLPLLKKRLLGFLVTTNQKRILREIEEKSAMLQKEVTLKDIEITNYLLKLTNNNKLGDQICLKLKKIGDQLSGDNISLLPDINEIIRDVEFYHKSSFWETLDEHFIRTHPEFTKNLLAKHPTITPAEMKLATLLSLQLNTKDIANVMIQGYDSIRVSRTRLRKKLGLSNGDNLQAYLLSLFNQ
ncbi:MAG: PAS domain S-box protein [Bacteroidales bacterium]|nr:PAS domain S-box protein [Bacteroidales bacterium]